MRIAIIATGSRGDVQPYVALGQGLKNAGHSVRLVTHQNFAGLVNEHGLEFWPVAGDIQEIVETEEMRATVEKGNFLTLMAKMAKEAERGALSLAESGLAACQGMDLLLGGMGGGYVGIALAEKLKLPFLQAYLLPFTPTRDFASVLVARPPAWFGGSINHLSHQLTRQILWQSFRGADAQARKKVLGMQPAPFLGPYNAECTRGLPVLYGFSPSVIPAPSDWGKNVQVTGYWFLDSSESWTPPAALVDFLDAGAPPVYIGFGSMSNRDPEQTANLVVEALQRTGQRAVVLSGWGGLRKADLPESVFMIDSVPHAWLFPRVAAVVHHGGAGTTAAGLRAGVPSIIIPFFGDQPFWGWRIARAGVGPEPIARKSLSVERLAAALKIAVEDAEMRRKAEQLGEKIREEDGVGRAVQVIEGLGLAGR